MEAGRIRSEVTSSDIDVIMASNFARDSVASSSDDEPLQQMENSSSDFSDCDETLLFNAE